MRPIRRLIIHHSASSRETSFEKIAQGHLDRGFTKIGYHFVVEDGELRRGRDIDEVGAHASGANADSIGICIVGDNTVAGRGWEPHQVSVAQDLIHGLQLVLGPLELQGHRDITATLCPGVEVREIFH